MQREVASGSSELDFGPRRPQVAALFPGGPAQRAGLRLGDVLTAVDGQGFGNGSSGAFAAALRRTAATPGAPRSVTLSVERSGGPVLIVVPLPADDGVAGEPASNRGAIGARALEWLSTRQTRDGGFPETLSGVNGVVVQASLAGLAWLAGETGAGAGPHAVALGKAARYVAANVAASDGLSGAGSDGFNWNQSNWGYVHAAIFLGELCTRRPSAALLRDLQRCADVISRNQAGSGGWGHGPGGRNALGYVELNVVAGLALNGLGLAKRAGCSVDPSVVARAAAYLDASSGPDGGVGYSSARGQKGSGNIARSAAAWLGYRKLGLDDRLGADRLKTYVGLHAGHWLDGHASLMQQVLWAGTAAQAIGGAAENRFWASVDSELALARAPDGSLHPRPWHESLQLGANCDVMTGAVWTTASWAIVLLAAPAATRAGLPALLGRP